MNPLFYAGKDRRIVHFLLAILLPLAACQTDHRAAANQARTPSTSYIRYARGFDLQVFPDYRILRLFNEMDGSGDTLQYLLAKHSSDIADKPAHRYVIRTPVQNVALLHSSYIAYFEMCGGLQQVTAISDAGYVYHPGVRRAVDENIIEDLGSGQTVDLEAILALSPDVVIDVGFPGAPNQTHQRLRDLGIPVLPFSEWRETTPMGRMEWVKIVGSLLGRDQEAREKLDETARSYHRYRKLGNQITQKPTVLCNAPFKGSWYLPGKDSYMGNLLRDAAASYIGNDIPGSGAVPLGLEEVFLKAGDAAYWINPGSAASAEEIAGQDSRLSRFGAFSNHRIYNCDRRTNAHGANDYWESGLVNPDLILADMLHILHPGLLPSHAPVYFRKLDRRIDVN